MRLWVILYSHITYTCCTLQLFQVPPAPKPKQAGATLLLKLKSSILAKKEKEEQHAEQLQDPGIWYGILLI